jgi:hypothetical protein
MQNPGRLGVWHVEYSFRILEIYDFILVLVKKRARGRKEGELWPVCLGFTRPRSPTSLTDRSAPICCFGSEGAHFPGHSPNAGFAEAV